MGKVYIVEKSTGNVKYFGLAKDKPSLSGPNYEDIPSSNPPPDGKYTQTEYVYLDRKWVLSQKKVCSEKTREINAEKDGRLRKSDLLVLSHMEQVELVKRGKISKTDITDAQYEKWLMYRYNILHILTPTKLTGTATFTNHSKDVTGNNTLFSSEVQVGQYIQAEGSNISYKIQSISSNTSIILESDFQQQITTTTAEKITNLDNPDWPTKP